MLNHLRQVINILLLGQQNPKTLWYYFYIDYYQGKTNKTADRSDTFKNKVKKKIFWDKNSLPAIIVVKH